MAFYRKLVWLVVAWLLSFAVLAKDGSQIGVIAVAELPPEARYTLEMIKEGRPMPYAKDGTVFKNYEGLLPRQKRGYYREFTVKTPGVRHRGARRIVAGGEPGRFREYFYTDDHYVSFKRIRE